ncbi:MAG: glycosyltransferase, partial [Micrococcales bacterium]|nr:glycosyltransferase [Micrococcales bacterium]
VYAREGWIPLAAGEDGTILVGASRELNPTQEEAISDDLGAPIEVVPVSQQFIVDAVIEVFAAEFAAEAADGLANANPVRSARTVLSRGQVIGFAIVASVAVLGAVLLTGVTLVVILAAINLFFLASVLFKFVVAFRGSRYDLVNKVSRFELAMLDEDELPFYTVLVPVFREEKVVAQLMTNLGRLDYPRDRLEVLILVEEGDDATRAAIARSAVPEHFIVVPIPAGVPQTKPRACNVGLELARGEFLVIFDAEDAPEPDQLKKAVIVFSRTDESTAVVQASLNYFNARENALTRLFTLEYGAWFDYMLMGLEDSDLPIPLGGTSNHFRMTALRRLGGWDPYNVTEDADLGIRASALGYRVGVVDATTMEEATSRIPQFIKQRSRWIKGYMQTALVHSRQPIALIRRIGLRRFAAFALLIAGTPFTFLSVIPFAILLVLALALPFYVVPVEVPPIVIVLSALNFLLGYSLLIYMNMMGPYKRGLFGLVPWALLKPLFWIL